MSPNEEMNFGQTDIIRILKAVNSKGIFQTAENFFTLTNIKKHHGQSVSPLKPDDT